MEPAEPQGTQQPESEGPGEGSPDGSGFVRMGLLFYGAMAVAAVVWRLGFYREPILFASPSDQAAGVSLVRDVLVGAAAAGALIGVSDWMTRTTRWGEDLARSMAQALGPLTVPDALLLALASGLAEELLFRGALQPRVGFVLASLLFGCVHFVPRREFLPWTGFAIAAGFLFGALFWWTGNLVAPVVAHTLVNGVNLPILVRRYGVAAGSPPPPPLPGS